MIIIAQIYVFLIYVLSVYTDVYFSFLLFNYQ